MNIEIILTRVSPYLIVIDIDEHPFISLHISKIKGRGRWKVFEGLFPTLFDIFPIASLF